MKREILFRGKRVDNGEWVGGFYGYKLESDKHFIMYEEINSNCPSYFMDIEVIPETVGQFTGLTDKNGKMIFEGDKLKTNYYSQYIVEDMIDFAVYCDDYIIGDSNTQTDMEVIGNIHDNYK